MLPLLFSSSYLIIAIICFVLSSAFRVSRFLLIFCVNVLSPTRFSFQLLIFVYINPLRIIVLFRFAHFDGQFESEHAKSAQ